MSVKVVEIYLYSLCKKSGTFSPCALQAGFGNPTKLRLGNAGKANACQIVFDGVLQMPLPDSDEMFNCKHIFAQKKTSEEVFWVTELLLLFICSSYATSANIFGGFLSVYFHLYFFEVGAVRSRSLSVGVAHKIAGHLAFTANCTNF